MHRLFIREEGFLNTEQKGQSIQSLLGEQGPISSKSLSFQISPKYWKDNSMQMLLLRELEPISRKRLKSKTSLKYRKKLF